jgi:MFS transporter, BCD family, chlorophyll transporter
MNVRVASVWKHVGRQLLPFADAASPGLPLPRLLRLSLFQVSVGMAMVLLLGTLNRVMIVEMGVSAALVALMAALPVLIAPFRALLGFRSDTHRSAIGWRRVPYIWFGTLLQFGGLAIMPFALIVLSGDHNGPAWLGPASAALAFALTGAGMHTTQTAGLALATDLADDASRPRVVALLYVMLLVGMGVSAALFGWLLQDFSQVKLIQIIQGAAAATMLLNIVALWKQESLTPMSEAERAAPPPAFRAAWADFLAGGRSGRLLAAVALGTAGFAMQDILLEPYGGEVLALGVGATTLLTALWAAGSLVGFALAARLLSRGTDACKLAAWGALVGIVAFAAVVFAEPLGSAAIFRVGVTLIGFGGGLFAVGTLTAAMTMTQAGGSASGSGGGSGLALGAWGAAQATAAGLGVAAGGAIRDGVAHLAETGALGPGLTSGHVGYSVVYHLEIALLFAALVAIGPLVRRGRNRFRPAKFGIAEFPT